MNVIAFVPRAERDAIRAKEAYDRAYRNSNHHPAFLATQAAIEAAFDESAGINSFKRRVEYAIKRGTGHPANRARYGGRLRALQDMNLADAIAAVEGWYRREEKHINDSLLIRYAPQPSTLSLEVLRELRLMLRMLRVDGRSILGCKPRRTNLRVYFTTLVTLAS